MNARILVIDDEESFCEILKYNLEKEGYDVDTAYSAEEALTYDLAVYQLMIVDIMMDKMSGYEFIKHIRQNPATRFIPNILCSALQGEDNIVMGLNKGADDYITKPFVIGEVIARVKAVLRRAQYQYNRADVYEPQTAVRTQSETIATRRVQEIKAVDRKSDIIFKTIHIDHDKKTCFINGTDVTLTPLEFELLHFFLTQPERIHSRDNIMNNIWGTKVTPRAIDVTVARLRDKIKPYDANIVTRRGYGYGFYTDAN